MAASQEDREVIDRLLENAISLARAHPPRIQPTRPQPQPCLASPPLMVLAQQPIYCSLCRC